MLVLNLLTGACGVVGYASHYDWQMCICLSWYLCSSCFRSIRGYISVVHTQTRATECRMY